MHRGLQPAFIFLHSESGALAEINTPGHKDKINKPTPKMNTLLKRKKAAPVSWNLKHKYA
jgi:hypothetical protein